MWFKKSNLKKSKLVPNIIWALALCLVFFMWFILIKNTNIFYFNIDKNNNQDSDKTGSIDKKQTEKLTEDNWKSKINILLLWRWWGDHDAPNLTDTIIFASIDLKKKVISMLSVPRDIYVEYPDGYADWKINWIYAVTSSRNSSKKIWIENIKNKLTEMTWEKIDYYINVDFNWFKKIIDTIWWIEITIPENFVDYKYPDWNWWYKTLVFKQWTWVFDWENSLKYARSRHSTSDFDRSMRQQQVIKAIKDKLNWGYFLTSPWKVKELYDVFINHVDTDISLKTIIKLAFNLNWKWDFKIYSYNLNDSCYYWSATCTNGWFLYAPNRDLFWWMSVLLVEWTDINNLNDYGKINNYSDIIFNSSNIFSENYKINIFNWVKVRNLASVLSNDIIKYWFYIPEIKSIWNADKIYEKSVIYYNSIDENSVTIKALKKFFDWEFIKTDLPMFSLDNAQIEIIIWEDYNKTNDPFKF